jgi:hypothetical protein
LPEHALRSTDIMTLIIVGTIMAMMLFAFAVFVLGY